MHGNSWRPAFGTYLEAATPDQLKNALCLAPIFGDATHRKTYNSSSKHSLPTYAFTVPSDSKEIIHKTRMLYQTTIMNHVSYCIYRHCFDFYTKFSEPSRKVNSSQPNQLSFTWH